jgi:hypothetical protein
VKNGSDNRYGGRWEDGLNLQQIYEAGDPFERLIDHPSYVGKVRHFLGGEGTFDYAQGELFIDENFASIRGPGEAIGVHSGAGPGNSMRNQSFYKVRANSSIQILLSFASGLSLACVSEQNNRFYVRFHSQ